MPSNTVDIHFKGHDSGLTNVIRKVKADLQALKGQRIELKVDVDDRALIRLQDRMNAVRSKVAQVRAAVDMRELTELRSQLAALRDRTIRINVDLESTGALAGLAALDTSRGNVRVSLDLDTSVAAAELAAFVAAAPRNMTINLDVDTAGAAAELAAFRLALLALNSDTINLGTSSNAAASGMKALGGAAGSMAPQLAAILPVVGVLASGAIGVGIFGTAAALGAVTAAAGLMSVGFGSAVAALPIMAAASSQKVKDHFTFMADDVVATMKSIAEPLQEPLVGLATAVGAAFHQIRPSLELITAGVGTLINELSGKMPAIAAEVGPALEKMFTGAVPHIRNLTNEIPNIIASIGDFAGKLGDPAIVEGAKRVFGMLPGIITGAGDALVSMGEKFNSTMAYLDSGKLDGFTSGISSFIDEMAGTDWSTTTAGLTDAANAFGDFVGSLDGAQINRAITSIAELVTGLTKIGGAMTNGFLNLNDWVDRNLQFDQLSTQLSNLFQDLGLEPVEVPVKLTDVDRAALAGLLGVEIPVPVVPEPRPLPPLPPSPLPLDLIPGPMPILPPAQLPPLPPAPLPLDLIPGAMPPVPPPPPVPVPLEPGTMPPPPPPPPVPVDVTVEGAVTVPQPPPVPISFDVTQPTLVLTPPPPVPISFDVALPTITIPPPQPVPVVVLPPDVSRFVLDLTDRGTAAGETFAAGLAGAAGSVAAAAASMAAAAQNVSVDLSAQGAAAGSSFAAGLSSQSGAVAAAAAQLGAVAAANKGHYKGRRGIAADRIMLIPHGRAMVKGFIGGMQSQRGDLVRAARGLAGDVYTAFDDALVPNIGLSGGMEIRQKVIVQVEAGLMADPVKIGREVKDVLNAYGKEVGSSSQVIHV